MMAAAGGMPALPEGVPPVPRMVNEMAEWNVDQTASWLGARSGDPQLEERARARNIRGEQLQYLAKDAALRRILGLSDDDTLHKKLVRKVQGLERELQATLRQSWSKQNSTPASSDVIGPADEPSPSSIGAGASQPSCVDGGDGDVRAQVAAIYQKYAPHKTKDIDELMGDFEGQEEQLLANVRKKWVPLADDPRAQLEEGASPSTPPDTPERIGGSQGASSPAGTPLGSRAPQAVSTPRTPAAKRPVPEFPGVKLEDMRSERRSAVKGTLQVTPTALHLLPAIDTTPAGSPRQAVIIPLHLIDQASMKSGGGGFLGGFTNPYLTMNVRINESEFTLPIRIEFESGDKARSRDQAMKLLQLTEAQTGRLRSLGQEGTLTLQGFFFDDLPESALEPEPEGDPLPTSNGSRLPCLVRVNKTAEVKHTVMGGHTVYILQCENSDGYQWHVRKRFSEFDKLRGELQRRSPSFGQHSFPSNTKSRIPGSSTSADVTAERQKELETWANKIVTFAASQVDDSSSQAVDLLASTQAVDLLTSFFSVEEEVSPEPSPTGIVDIIRDIRGSIFVQPVEEPMIEVWPTDSADSAQALEAVLPYLPHGVNCGLLDQLGGGPAKDGYMYLESTWLGKAKSWSKRWFVLWPQTSHPTHGQLLFYFGNRHAKCEGCIQLQKPVIKKPKKERAYHYAMRLAATVVETANLTSVTEEKFILGCGDLQGEDGIESWISALRAAGPSYATDGSSKPAGKPDASNWLYYSSTGSFFSWERQWCELRETELSRFGRSTDLRCGLVALRGYTLHTPELPDAHREREFILVPPEEEPSGASTGHRPAAFECFAAQNQVEFGNWKAKLLAAGASEASPAQQRQLKTIVGGWGLFSRAGRSAQGAASGALSAEDARVCPEDFEIRSVLGKGGFGKVFLVCKADRDDLLAMKVMNKASIIEKDQIEHIQQERRVLQAVHHPFIISLEYAFHTPTDLFLVLEFCQGGDVYETMQARPRGSQHFNEKEARFICAEITLALGHLHSQDIAFRDLKPENVLFDMEGHVRLTDFGLAKPSVSTSLRETTCGTPLYMSPEGVQNHAHDSPKHPAGAGGWPGLAVDWWMLGVLMYELTLGDTPFLGSDMAQLMQSITRDDVSFKDNHGLSESCVDIIKKLLHRKPEHRLGGKSTDQVQDHEWFAGLDWERLLRKEIPPPYVPEPCTDEHGNDDPLRHFPQRMTEQPVTNADFSTPVGRQRQLDPDPFKDSDSGVNDFYYDRVEAQLPPPKEEMSPQWTPYADAISEQIETAYQGWVASAAAAEGRDGQDPPRVSIFPRREGPEQPGPEYVVELGLGMQYCVDTPNLRRQVRRKVDKRVREPEPEPER